MLDEQKIFSIIDDIKSRINPNSCSAASIEAKQFIQQIMGENSCFYRDFDKTLDIWFDIGEKSKVLSGILDHLKSYIKNGLLNQPSLIRKTQIETVNDYLELAQNLFNDSEIHPAAPAMIIGASLEEFLRNWVDEIGKITEINKNTIQAVP